MTRLPVDLLAAAMTPDDEADLATAFTHIGDALDIYEANKEQNQ